MIAMVFIASFSQILLKQAAAKIHRNKLAEYLNWRVVLAYSLFFFASIVNMYILRHIPLSLAPVLETSGYVFIAVLGWFFLGDRINKTQLFGLILIIIGIIVFSI